MVLFFNQNDAIFHGRKGASKDSECIHLGVCQVAGVKVVGCHIGIELVTPTNIGARCDAGIEEVTPRFGVRNVAEHLSNLCSIVSVTYLDSGVEISFQITQFYAQSSLKDERDKLPYLSARTSREKHSNTPLQRRDWNNRSPAIAWKVVSPHLRQTSRAPYW